MAHAINIGQNARMHLSDEGKADTGEPILKLIGRQRGASIASRETRDGAPVSHSNIRLRGEGGTLFFEI